MPWVEQTQKIKPADSLAPSRAVLEALIHGGDAPSGEHGRLAVATLVAAHVSHETGHRPVRVDDNLPADRAFPWA
jgi:hypothetical protein